MIIKHKRRRSRIKNRLLFLAAAILLVLVMADMQLRPVIKTVAAYSAKTQAVRAINDAVNSEISSLGLTYNSLVYLTYDENGNVTSLQTNMAAMNMLQTGLTNRIIDEIVKMTDQSISVPLGSLIGGQLLSGRGPRIEIKLIPSSYVETSINNTFVEAGINQTRHQILLTVNMTISAIIPGYSVTSEVHTDVCVAETVVVGLVPDAYTQVGDGTGELEGMIKDYGANESRTSEAGKN